MKQKIVIVSWLVFSIIYLSSTLADTEQSQAETNQNEPQKPRLITFEDQDKFKYVGSGHVSKDGKLIAYTLSDQIWIIPVEGGEPYAVTTKGSSAWNPVWTPDGKALSFLSSRSKDHTQVWKLKFDHFGEAQQITKLKRSARSIKWSPQGDKLLFVFKDEKEKEEKEKEKDSDKKQDSAKKPWVIDRLEFKADRGDGYITDRRHNHIYIYDIAKDKLTQITSGDYDDSSPVWSPDGKTIAFVSNRTENSDRNYNTDIWLVSADTKDKGQNLTQLTSHTGPDDSPLWSPDGKSIVYTSASDGEYGVAYLTIVPSKGGQPKILTKNMDRRASDIKFSDDGKSIYFIYPDSGSQHLARIASNGGPVKPIITGLRVVNS